MLGSGPARAGWILKEGGFACGSKQLSASLSRVLLVLFLAGQGKNIPSLYKEKGSRYTEASIFDIVFLRPQEFRLCILRIP